MNIQKYVIPLLINLLVIDAYTMDAAFDEQLEAEAIDALAFMKHDDRRRIDAVEQLLHLLQQSPYIQLSPIKRKQSNKRAKRHLTPSAMTELIKKLLERYSYDFDHDKPIDSLLHNLNNPEFAIKILHLVTLRKPNAEMVRKITFAHPLSQEITMAIRKVFPKVLCRGCSHVLRALLEKQDVIESLTITIIRNSIKDALKGSGEKKFYYVITELFNCKGIYDMISTALDEQPELFDNIFTQEDIRKLNTCWYVTPEIQKLLKRFKPS